MSTINAIQLKCLLLDSILHARNGMHLTRHYGGMKKTFCQMVGISPRTTSKKLIEVIRDVYINNGMEAEFTKTIEKFPYSVPHYKNT
jgi:hypothetical protein